MPVVAQIAKIQLSDKAANILSHNRWLAAQERCNWLNERITREFPAIIASDNSMALPVCVRQIEEAFSSIELECFEIRVAFTAVEDNRFWIPEPSFAGLTWYNVGRII